MTVSSAPKKVTRPIKHEDVAAAPSLAHRILAWIMAPFQSHRTPPAESDDRSVKNRPESKEPHRSSREDPAEAPATRRLPGKGVLIALLLSGTGVIATATYIVISLEMKKHDEEATLALEKRYKTLEQRNLALEMKYKKMTRKPAASQPVAIEARTPAPPIAPASIAATSAPASIAATSAPASIAATSAPANVTAVSPSKPDLAADCTAISDKASAGDVLKRCIDAFNAASRH